MRQSVLLWRDIERVDGRLFILFPAYLHPCLLHCQRVFFHDRAFAQNATTAAEII